MTSEQDARGREALDQAVEQRLALGVDPVEILEEHEERLDLTFPQEEPLDRVQGPLPALRRVEGTPRDIVDGDIEQRQERRQERLQRPVQRQEFARHSFANLPRVVALLDAEICLQQLDDGQVRRGPPIGDRAAFEHQPTVGAVRPRELPDEAGFPDAGLAHDGDRLPVSGAGVLERSAEHLDLGVPADEPGEPAPRGGLQSRARRTDAGQLVDLDGLAATFHRHRTQGLHGDEPFDQVERRRRDQHRARARGLFHARGEMRRLPDRRVVHAQVIADRARPRRRRS